MFYFFHARLEDSSNMSSAWWPLTDLVLGEAVAALGSGVGQVVKEVPAVHVLRHKQHLGQGLARTRDHTRKQSEKRGTKKRRGGILE